MESNKPDPEQLHKDLLALKSEIHGLKSEIVRLERMIKENELRMDPVVAVYKKILASSEVGGFVAKVIGGVLGMLGAIASLWLIIRGGNGGGG